MLPFQNCVRFLILTVMLKCAADLYSLYWALSTLTTVGYGDVTPLLAGEVMFACTSMFVGSILMGYVIGNVSSIIAQEDSAKIAIRSRIDSLNAYMRFRDLPQSLVRRVRAHFDFNWSRSTVCPVAFLCAESSRRNLKNRLKSILKRWFFPSLRILMSGGDSVHRFVTRHQSWRSCHPSFVHNLFCTSTVKVSSQYRSSRTCAANA